MDGMDLLLASQVCKMWFYMAKRDWLEAHTWKQTYIYHKKRQLRDKHYELLLRQSDLDLFERLAMASRSLSPYDHLRSITKAIVCERCRELDGPAETPYGTPPYWSTFEMMDVLHHTLGSDCRYAGNISNMIRRPRLNQVFSQDTIPDEGVIKFY
ncbi:hypothetical protein EDD86DRAFT_247124 [Gorgonomyces haynaldii]|nr:hypothetical protein EDD86DRAFT_247124 [Gorgonomyces haynaldii]